MAPPFVNFRNTKSASMKYPFLFFKVCSFILLILFVIHAGPLRAEMPRDTSFCSKKEVPVFELKGDSYNRGLQHGKAFKIEIASVISRWKESILETVKGDPDSTITAFIKATNFIPVTEQKVPGIMNEVKGIAEGSGQSFKDIYAFQLVDEFWVYLDKQYNTANHHCSGMGVAATTNHPAYIAQNMDLETYMEGFQVLLHIEASATEPEQYILSCMGLVALGGMNEEGVALCMNTIMELQASADGLPVAFMIRGVLGKQNGHEAMAFLKSVKHASGQNYIMAVNDSVYDFEASSNEVVRYWPKAGDDAIVYHTNHALANHDVKDWYKKYHQQVMGGLLTNGNSIVRFTSLQQRLDKKAIDISTEVIKNTLRSKDDPRHPVCRNYSSTGGGYTFSSIIYTTSGKRSVQLTHGSPDQADYVEYFFR